MWEIDSRGRSVRLVKTKALRHGRFEAFVAEAKSARIALRLNVGRNQFWSEITVVDTRAEAIACEHGTASAPVLELGGLLLRAGQPYSLEFRITGRCPLGAMSPWVNWERPTVGLGWEPVPINCAGNSVLIPGAPAPSAICEG